MAKDTGKVLIHGKEYETVASRVNKFREAHNDTYGTTTEIVSIDDQTVVMKASIVRLADDRVVATGHAEEDRQSSTINKTSALENCETSAIGRALAAFGLAGTEFASADEVAQAIGKQSGSLTKKPRFATMKQVELMVNKVKWGRNTFDKDEIVNYLQQVIGKPVQEVLMSDMDETLEKIDKALREDKVLDKVDDAVVDPDQVITEIPEGEINLDKIPY